MEVWGLHAGGNWKTRTSMCIHMHNIRNDKNHAVLVTTVNVVTTVIAVSTVTPVTISPLMNIPRKPASHFLLTEWQHWLSISSPKMSSD